MQCCTPQAIMAEMTRNYSQHVHVGECVAAVSAPAGTRAADDVSEIARRARELKREQEMSENIDMASGEWLDLHGRRSGVDRRSGESDYSYRGRIKEACK